MTSERLRRDLALFQLYRLLSTSYLFAPVIKVFFAGRGLSFTETTLLNSVYCVTAMLFEVPTGVLADRWGRRRAMVVGSLMMAAGCLLDYAGHSFALFAVGEGLLALGMTLTSGADSAWLYDLLRDTGRAHEYQKREGAASAAKLVGAAVALAVGGWLARRDVASTYLFTAFVCLGASLAAALLDEPRFARATPRPALRQMVESTQRVLTHRPLAFAVLFSSVIFTLVQLKIYLHQPYLTAAGFDIFHVGLVMAGMSLLAAIGAHRIDWLRSLVGERALLWGLPAALALSYALMAGWFQAWGVALLAVQCVAGGLYSPLSKELLNREIADSSRRATILSVESMARRLAFGAFAPLVGLLIDRYDLHVGLAGCAVFGAVGVIAIGGWLARRPARLALASEVRVAPSSAVPAPIAVSTSAQNQSA